MGFADDLVADTRRINPCRVEVVRQQMADETREGYDPRDLPAFDAALEDREAFGTSKIIRIVQQDPGLLRIGREAIDKHRARVCVCYLEV